MKALIALLLILPVLLLAQSPALLLSQSNDSRQTAPLVLAHVTVIDVSGGPSKSNMTVVIRGDRISDIGKAGEVLVPPGATVLDASGKFLIPGLWDMHVHWYNRDSLTLFTANGVTGVRQMFGGSDLLRWRDQIAQGSLNGPRMIVASPIIDGPEPVWPNSIAVDNEDEGRNAVRKVKQWGADFVKVYSLLPRDAYFAIADESKRQDIPFAGHVPFAVSAAETSDAGQKSIEHLTGILIECSDKATELRNEIAKAKSPGARGRVEGIALQTFNDRKARELFARFVKNQTWQCPTLTVLRSSSGYLGDSRFRNDGRLKYVPRPRRERWVRQIADQNDSDYAKKVFQKKVEIAGAMQRAGVPLLAGTDAGNPFCFPGFSLHEELALMVLGGLTPSESLRAATLNPAKFLGLDKMLGTIESGKIADLVLLDADPLADIRNTQRINAVISNGRLLDRKALNDMLARAEMNAR
jgi:hypothetical protein